MVEHGRAWTAVAAGAALAVLASVAATSPAAAAPPTPRPQAAAVPALAWAACEEDAGLPPEVLGGTYQCAVARVPLDHDAPAGPTIELALKRRRADAPAQRIGSLFVNPGGPGVSGVDFVGVAGSIYPKEVLARFDVVGFDPRGVARSAPLVCFSGEEFFQFYRHLPAFPITAAQERQLAASFAGYTRRCAGHPIVGHMSTADVARDLDLLRAAVGDQRLTYAGYSYGTQLGTTYANLFPAHVRALVLDGVVDPVAWTTGVQVPRSLAPADLARRSSLPVSTRLRSAEGTYATLQQFFARCRAAGPQRCALAQGDPQRRFDRLAARLLTRPVEVPLGGGLFQRIGYAELVTMARSAMYSPAVWPDFAALVAEVEGFRDPARAGQVYRRLSAALDPADEPEAEPAFQTVEGNDGVLCSDSTNPRSASAWSRAALEADRVAPYFGRAWTWASIACATWPASAVEDRYTGPWNARTAAPVLVVGNRYDPATPHSGAQTVAGLLPASRLLTLDGWGHVALGQSSCIDAHVSAYLLKGTLPRSGAVCAPDVQPFAPPDAKAALRISDRTKLARQEARQLVLSELPAMR